MVSSLRTAMSVVPPPISAIMTPSALSSSLRTASALASGSMTRSSISTAEPADALGQVLDRGHGGGNDVGLNIQTETVHADRVLDPFLAIHDVRPGDNVEDLMVRRDFDGAGDLQDSLQVGRPDQLITAGDGDNAMVVDRTDMATGNADIG